MIAVALGRPGMRAGAMKQDHVRMGTTGLAVVSVGGDHDVVRAQVREQAVPVKSGHVDERVGDPCPVSAGRP